MDGKCAEFTIDLVKQLNGAQQLVENLKNVIGSYANVLSAQYQENRLGYEIYLKARKPYRLESMLADLLRHLIRQPSLKNTSNNRLTVRQAAQKLGVTPRRVNDLIKSGRIKAEKFGDGKTAPWLISDDELHRFEKRNQRSRQLKEMTRKLKENGFYYNKQKGKKRGWWKDGLFYGPSAENIFL